MKNTEIIINFGDLVNEMKTKDFSVCFIEHARNIFVEHHNFIYAMEARNDLRHYLDFLIINGKVAKFLLIAKSSDIPDYRKEVWNSEEVLNFIERQRQYW